MSIAASHAVSPRPSVSAGPVNGAIFHLESEEAFGPATPTARTAKRVELLHLQLRRDLLIDRLRSLQRQSRNKEASACSAELRAVTTQLMAKGRHA